MKELLPDWYRIVDLKVDDEIVKKRELAIKKLIEDFDVDDILKCVLLFNGKNFDDIEFIGRIRKEFKAADNSFPSIDNDLELRVLAGGILAKDIDDGHLEDRGLTLLPIIASFFNGNTYEINLKNFIENCIKSFNTLSITIRNQDKLEKIKQAKIEKKDLTPDINQVVANIKTLSETIYNITNIYNHNLDGYDIKIKSLSEESNILWWLINNHSKDFNRSLNEIDKNMLGLIVGSELSNLIEFQLPPLSTKALIKEAVIKSGNTAEEKVIYVDSINGLGEEWKKKYKLDNDFILNFLPMHFSIKMSLETDNESVWISYVTKKFNIEPKLKVSIKDIAYQFLIERVFIKNYNEYNKD